jgi:hypothetical protein
MSKAHVVNPQLTVRDKKNCITLFHPKITSKFLRKSHTRDTLQLLGIKAAPNKITKTPKAPNKIPTRFIGEKVRSRRRKPRTKKIEFAISRSESLSAETKYKATLNPTFFLARKKKRIKSPVLNGRRKFNTAPIPFNPKIDLWLTDT